MYQLAIFASGNGTNAENIVKTFHRGDLLRVCVVLADNPDAGVFDRMKPFGIETIYVEPKTWRHNPEKVVEILRERGIDLVVLAGFMRLVAPQIVQAFPHRIINIHPALLPKYGGKGMYGHHVHEAVIAAGEKESGVTVHYVDEQYDHGSNILQEKVEITPEDTAETLEAKIHKVEYSIFPRAIVRALNALEKTGDGPAGGSQMPVVEPKPVETEEKKAPVPPIPAQPAQKPSVDQMWAETLRMDFDPNTAVPPPVPGAAAPQAPTVQRTKAQAPEAPKAPEVPSAEAAERPPMPGSYLVLAVICALLCSTIPAIIAIVYSTRVSARWFQGDYAGAERASYWAQVWVIISFCLGILSATLYIPMMIFQNAFGG